MAPRSSPTHIEIFAGCGGISLGLHNAGWRGLFAIEKNEMAFKTLRHNLIFNKNHFDWPSWLEITEHDITDLLKEKKSELKELHGHVDLVTGGPPCQGFSFAGLRKEQDARNLLIKSYIDFIDLVRPISLLFENVKGFTIGFKNCSQRSEAYSSTISRKLRKMGYNVKGHMIDFSEYGIPQKRKRYILLGMQEKNPDVFFSRIAETRRDFLENKGLSCNVNLDEAISDLERRHGEVNSSESNNFKEGVYGKIESPYQKLMRSNNGASPDSHRFARHRTKTDMRFRYFLENCQKNSRIPAKVKKIYKLRKKSIFLLDRKSQCPTLTTLPDDYIHYSEPRILTVREYARIQSFGDWFEFKGQYTTGGQKRKNEVPRYTQVGNAIPPLFTELVGQVLKAIM